MTFSTNVQLNWNLSNYNTKEELKTAIGNVNYDAGWTCTGKAMEMMTDKILCSNCPGVRSTSSKVVLFLTDGNPSRSNNCVPEVGITLYYIF